MNVVLAVAGTVLALAIALLAYRAAPSPLPALVAFIGWNSNLGRGYGVGRLKFADHRRHVSRQRHFGGVVRLGEFWLVGFPMFLAA